MDLAPEEVWIHTDPLQPKAATPLHAWYFHSQKPSGLIVFFHGNAQNISSHYLTLSWLPQQNYDYLIFDYRGYGKSTLSANERAPSPQSTVEDGTSVLKWAEAAARKRKIPLLLLGQSLGGNILLRSLQEYDPHPKSLTVDSSFLSYKKAGASVLKQSWLSWPAHPLAHLLLSDEWAPKNGALKSMPGNYPILVIHGDEDTVVPFQHGVELFDAMREPKTFWRIPGGKHTDVFWTHEWRYREKWLNFLDGSDLPLRKIELPPGIRIDRSFVYELPYEKGKSIEVIQGENGRFSHTGTSQFAIDLRMPEGTPVLAMRSGHVLRKEDRYSQGGPSESLLSQANLVLIRHEDGSVAEYVHLQQGSSPLKVGDPVQAGQPIGKSGSTGFSSEPHLHVMVFIPQEDFPALPQHSVPILFNTAQNPCERLEQGQIYRKP